jgi:hypothetical protein
MTVEPTASPSRIEARFPAQVGEQLADQLQPVMRTMLKETLKASKKDNLDTFKVHLTVTAEEGLELMEWLKARKARREALETEL